MVKNFLKLSWRNFVKYKSYSFINIFGLSIGLFTSLLIFLFIQDELSYDQFHEGADNIYRLEFYHQFQGEENHWAATTGFLGSEVARRYPEITSAVKFMKSSSTQTIRYNGKFFSDDNVLFADSSFLDVFSFEMKLGDRSSALEGPDDMIITESAAIKFFGNEDPIGKTLRVNQDNYTVSAVIEDVPVNSHFKFEVVVSLQKLRNRVPQYTEGRGAAAFYAYVKLDDKKALGELKRKLAEDVFDLFQVVDEEGNPNPPEGMVLKVLLNPITNIHLDGHAEKEFMANSDRQYIYIFGSIACFVLIIAAFNYMNLATARSSKRSKEVGVRKVLGAEKKQIFGQFIGESFLFTFLSILIALILIAVAIPHFNEFSGKQIDLNISENGLFMLAVVLVYFVVSFLSGIYPSLFLSNFGILASLKSDLLSGKSNKGVLLLRRALVIFQFAVSIFLIIAAATVHNQLDFIQNKSLGFTKEQVVVVKLPGRGQVQNIETLKNVMTANSNVHSAAISSAIPGKRVHILGVRVPEIATRGETLPNGDQDQGNRHLRVISADEDIVEALGFEIVDGRDLSTEILTDSSAGFLVNEAAVIEFGLENPVGKDFEYTYGLPEPKRGKIVGVLKDFHYASLHSDVEPLMIHVFPNHAAYLNIRISGTNVRGTLETLETNWNTVVADAPFNYFFLDETYDNQYKLEMNMSDIVSYFTFMAIVIACLGLFGLASFITEQRTKEIGVRKVLGASIATIMYELSKEFIVLVALANVVAIVPATYLLGEWLDGFAYSTDLSPYLFGGAAVLSVLIALFTISAKTYLAARVNPVNSLKHE